MNVSKDIWTRDWISVSPNPMSYIEYSSPAYSTVWGLHPLFSVVYRTT